MNKKSPSSTKWNGSQLCYEQRNNLIIMSNKNNINQFIKKPGTFSFYTKENIDDLVKCARDIIYFVEKFIKVQHPVKGAVNFKLYPYQKEMIKTFESYKYVIALTGRQLGKCISSETEIYYNGGKTKIGSLIFKYLNINEKIVYIIEKILLNLIIKREKYFCEIKNFNLFSKFIFLPLNLFINLLIFIFEKIIKIINHKKNDYSEKLNNKFTHIIYHQFLSIPYHVNKIFRTKPMECWLLKTENNIILGSGEHIFFDKENKKIYLRDCVPNKTLLKTINGEEKVVEIRKMNFKIHMYDVEVDHPSHLYYTNNIASHNTTCACAYILWKAIFNEDQTILIAANKLSSALEIMSRIRYMYEELPDFLKPGVTVYNKSSIEFDNRSRIISRPTTPDAGRGLSVSLLYCLHPETIVTIKDKETGNIEQISLKKLYEKLDSSQQDSENS